MAQSRLMPLLVVLLACGRGAGTSAQTQATEGGVVAADADLALAPLSLGMPELAAFRYRHRAGEAAFERARAGEAAGTWPAVVTACREALAADATHLDAAYLLAVALAKTGGTPAQIVEPLATAVAGDFAKWGTASLEQPALQPFLATPIGTAWRQRVATDRATFIAALARSLVVTSQGDLFAYDSEGARWYRLTRTGGAVVAQLAVRPAQKLAYVTRVKEAGKPTIGVGLVDLAAARTRRAIAVAQSGTVRIAWRAKPAPGFIVRAGKASWALVDNSKLELRPLPPKAKLVMATRLDVAGRTGKLARAAIENVSADWDEQSLASAIRIGTSHRVVTVPSPGLIDRNTATWSADRTQLAFVAQLDDTCAPGAATAAAFVADAATGSVQELERAVGGVAIEWVAERKLAVAGDNGVSIIDLGGGPPVVLASADGLASPRRKPLCSPEPVGEEPTSVDE